MSITDSPIITKLRTLSPGWLLLLAALTLPFSNGRLSVAAASWIAPIFLLRYTRLTTRPVRGFIAVWAVLFVVRWIAWFGLIPYPPPAFLVTSVLASLLTLLPLWIDRLLARRVPESVSTLVYPLAAVGIDFLVSVQSETTWTAIAYTQAGVLPVLQFASIFGLWGITFLIYWTAAVVNDLWDRAADRRTLVRSALVYLLVVSAVVLFGTIRLAWAPDSSRDVRVIALNPPDLFKILSREQLTIFQRFFMKLEVDPMEVAPILEEIRRANRGLLALGAKAVVSGADYLVWPEGGLIAFGDAEEQELVGIARDLAQDGGFYLGSMLIFFVSILTY